MLLENVLHFCLFLKTNGQFLKNILLFDFSTFHVDELFEIYRFDAANNVSRVKRSAWFGVQLEKALNSLYFNCLAQTVNFLVILRQHVNRKHPILELYAEFKLICANDALSDIQALGVDLQNVGFFQLLILSNSCFICS